MGGSGSGRKTALKFKPAAGVALYERQPGESDPAWLAFTTYRDMGLTRTLVKTRETLGKKPGYLPVIEGWSRTAGWRVRVEAWDAEVDRRRRKADLRAIEEMRVRHTKLAMSLQGLGATELQKVLEDARKKGAKVRLSADQIARFIELGMKQERVSRGEPEEIYEQRTKVMDEAEIDDRIAQLLKAYDGKKK